MRHAVMRFREYGKMTSRRGALALAVVIAITAMVVGAPVVSAQATSVRTADVFLSASRHTVPNVVGWSASSAATALHARGFGHRYEAPKGAKVVHPSKWTVIRQSPKAKTHANHGRVVILHVITTRAYLAKQVRSFYLQNYKSFKKVVTSGSGNETIALPKGVTAVIVTSTFSGAGRFTIVELGAGGAPTGRTLVHADKKYSGTDAIGLVAAKQKTTAIEVNGSGSWKVTVAPIGTAPILSMPAKGTGDHVYLYSGASALWTVSSPGPTTFMLNQISSSSYPNLAVDESGNFAGPVAIQPGPSVIEIHSNGSWTIH